MFHSQVPATCTLVSRGRRRLRRERNHWTVWKYFDPARKRSVDDGWWRWATKENDRRFGQSSYIDLKIVQIGVDFQVYNNVVKNHIPIWKLWFKVILYLSFFSLSHRVEITSKVSELSETTMRKSPHSCVLHILHPPISWQSQSLHFTKKVSILYSRLHFRKKQLMPE